MLRIFVICLSIFLGSFVVKAQNFQGDLITTHCVSENTFQLEVVLENGTQPFQYIWSNSALSGAYVSGLALGSYCVVVYDALGDSLVLCESILEPSEEVTYLSNCGQNLVIDGGWTSR